MVAVKGSRSADGRCWDSRRRDNPQGWPDPGSLFPGLPQVSGRTPTTRVARPNRDDRWSLRSGSENGEDGPNTDALRGGMVEMRAETEDARKGAYINFKRAPMTPGPWKTVSLLTLRGFEHWRGGRDAGL